MSRLVPVSESQIILGKPVGQSIFKSDGQLLLKAGQAVHSLQQLNYLLRNGVVEAEEEKVYTAESYLLPFELIRDALKKAVLFYKNYDAAGEETRGYILEIARMVQEACSADPEAAIATIFLARWAKYSHIHHIHTAIISELVARELDWAKDERLMLIGAALTMNVPMIELQDKLYAQGWGLTGQQKGIIREHPEAIFEFLGRRGIVDFTWKEAILYHHEAVDGSGYPFGLKGEDVPLSARILSMADIYCAKISDREYRKALPVNRATQGLVAECGPKVGADIVQTLIKLTGIYPPGTYVRLASGETAIVAGKGRNLLCPRVLSLTNTKGVPLKRPEPRDCELPQFNIVASLPLQNVGGVFSSDVLEFWRGLNSVKSPEKQALSR